jgi:hypothetical protein
VQSAVNSVSLPYIAGAPEPKIRKPIEPHQLADRRINPLWIIEQRDSLMEFNLAWFNYYGHYHPRYDSQLKQLERLGESMGVDMKAFSPTTFTLADIKDKDSLFEATSDQVEELARRIEESHEMGLKLLPEVKKKRWVRVLRRVISIQKMVLSKKPPKRKGHKATADEIDCWRYQRALRYMLYVDRSNLNSHDGSFELMDAPEHVVMMAMVITCAREHRESHHVSGCCVQVPPRHGKTKYITAERALLHHERPDKAVGIVHNNGDLAEDRLNMVRDHFKDDLAIGRRRKALFPRVTLDPATKGRAAYFFLLVDGKRVCREQEGNLHAYGIHHKSQGVTCHELMIDDPVDEKEVHEEGTRERTNSAMDLTWMSRLTGQQSFYVYICTSWHGDDYSSRLRHRVRAGAINIGFLSIECGGPEDNFRAIWPEAGYNARFLESKYLSWGPARYACVYMNDPDSEEARRISRLHFYDERVWENDAHKDPDWDRFFASPETTYYLSVDPSGSGSKYSNLAGITYCAFGMLRVKDKVGGLVDIPKVVFLKYWSFPASQNRLTAVISTVSENHRVDLVLVETTGGYHATSENLTEFYGFAPGKVIKKTPGTGTKLARFMQYAIHIERGDVLFPGVWGMDEHGNQILELSPRWQEMASQIFRAGTMSDTNLLDCVRQQLGEVSYTIYQMLGETSEAEPMVEPYPTKQAQNRRRMWQELMQGGNQKPIGRGRTYQKFAQGAFTR